jgi:hypothetical protein
MNPQSGSVTEMLAMTWASICPRAKFLSRSRQWRISFSVHAAMRQQPMIAQHRTRVKLRLRENIMRQCQRERSPSGPQQERRFEIPAAALDGVLEGDVLVSEGSPALRVGIVRRPSREPAVGGRDSTTSAIRSFNSATMSMPLRPAKPEVPFPAISSGGKGQGSVWSLCQQPRTVSR